MSGSMIKLLFLIYIQLHSIALLSEGRRESMNGIGYHKNLRNRRCNFQSSPYGSIPDPPICGTGRLDYSRKNSKSNRILRGEDTKPGEFPYHVIVKNFDESAAQKTCGGVIINNRFILTSAHCLIKRCTNPNGRPSFIGPKHIKLVLGDHLTDEKDGETIMDVSHVVPHKDYRCRAKDDIALIRLSQRIIFRITRKGYGSINTVCLPNDNSLTSEQRVGKTAILLGLGGPEANGTILEKASVKFIEDSYCEKKFGENFDKKKQICMANMGEFGASCTKDFGEPVLHKRQDGSYELVALVPFNRTIDCGVDTEVPYTRVENYLNWVLEWRIFFEMEPDRRLFE